MTKLDCDIIYDLLPSYIDGICTQTTRRSVEAHLADCPACAAKARQLRETAVSGESLERIALDAAKKIKRRVVWRAIVRLALALPFLAFGSAAVSLCLWGNLTLFTGHILRRRDLFTLLGLCLLVCALCLPRREKGLQREDRRALLLSLLVMAASTALMLYGYFTLIAGEACAGIPTLFGIPIGPLARGVYAALSLTQAALFLRALRRLWKRNIRTVLLLQTALTGMTLPLAYLAMLCSMELTAGVDSLLSAQLQDTGLTLLTGAAGILLGLLAEKWRKGRNKRLPFGKSLL